MKMVQITPSELNDLVGFVKVNYGINLTNKKQLIEARLNSILVAHNFTSFTQYLDLVKKKNPEDIDKMLSVLTTNHTYFMRETEHFDYFRDAVLPTLKPQKSMRKTLNIWSAGCSSGE